MTQAAVERADRRVAWLVALGGLLSIGGQAIPEFVAQAALFPVWWNISGLAATAAIVLLAVAGLRLPMSVLRILWISVPALVVALQLSSYAVIDHGVAPLAPWVWRLEPTAVTLLVFVVRPLFAIGATVVAGATVALSAWMFTGAVPEVVAWNTPFHMSEVGFVVIFIGIRNRVALLNEREDAARTAAQHSAAAAADAEHQSRLSRLVHDEVLSVLNAAVLFGGPPPAVLRDEAANAVRVLDSAIDGDASEDENLPAAIAAEQLRRRLAPLASIVEVAGAEDGPVPSRVVESIGAAAAEALRNASRHARARRIEAAVRISAGRVAVVVVDDGRGFDPTRTREGAMGVSDSILGRMTEIGGRARVQSAPGSGTEVWLSWPAAS